MRILYHHRTQAEDGQAVHIRSLIRAFETTGHEVHEVGLVRAGSGAGSDAGSGGAPSPRSGRARWSWVTRLPRFARELAEYGYNGIARRKLVGEAARFEPDFVYERYAFGNAAGVLATRKLGLPLVLEVNSPMVLELERTRGLSFPGFARKLESFVYRSAERVCVVTRVLADMLADLGVERERLLVTPNGVDLGLYERADPEAARRDALRALGLAPEGGAVLGFVGYYRDWHRLDVAVRGLATRELADARLVLIGEGPAREELAELARELGVSGRVHFAGRRAHREIPGLLCALDVALIPAINPYASPLKLHEYMAAGLAVVAPDQENLRELLVDGENALLVPAGDADALSAAIVRLVGDGALRGRLGSAARATVEREDLTWEANARRVVAAVQELR